MILLKSNVPLPAPRRILSCPKTKSNQNINFKIPNSICREFLFLITKGDSILRTNHQIRWSYSFSQSKSAVLEKPLRHMGLRPNPTRASREAATPKIDYRLHRKFWPPPLWPPPMLWSLPTAT